MAFNKENYLKLLEGVKTACAKVGRNSSEVKILAATKYADFQSINYAIEAGICLIGENKIQDAKEKIKHILPVKKHFIGHLQGNKVKTAVQIFDCIESVDSLDLAEKINHEAKNQQKNIQILLEVNIANDPKKFGLKPEEVLLFLDKISHFEYVKIGGLMAIVPFTENPEAVRPFFKKMKDLFENCRKKNPELEILSIGMSNDFKIAIEEGATEIRIGSYLFN